MIIFKKIQTSLDWNNLVTAKKTSVASFFVNFSPCVIKYKIFVNNKQHFFEFKGVSLKILFSCNTIPLSNPWKGINA